MAWSRLFDLSRLGDSGVDKVDKGKGKAIGGGGGVDLHCFVV